MTKKLIRVREFAEQMGCTPQNIYLHLKNHAEALEGHVIDSRQGKLLDEYACEFLRSVMYPRELDANSEAARLNEELNEMRAAFMRVGQENLRLASDVLEITADRDRLLLVEAQSQKLLNAAEDKTKEAEEKREAAEKKAAEEAQERSRVEEENHKLQEQLEAERAARAAAEAQNAALKGRSLWERIVRKGEK